jgi:ketosteroid isomerase-like protein
LCCLQGILNHQKGITMSTIKENVQKLNEMILEGRILDAFDKFYADDVVMRDNEGSPREGKDVCRQFEEDFVNNLTAFRGAEVKNVLISEDAGIATVEWDFDYSHREWGDRKYTQVAVQRWSDGKIINEQFLYQN